MVDYYACLGVPTDASLAEIKSAYRSLVKRYHPDMHPFDDPAARRKNELAMNQINTAYAVLSNSAERQRYDEQFQEYIARCNDPLTSDASMNTEAEVEIGSRPDWPGLFSQWLSDQRAAAQQKPVMGVFRKALLVPIPFCIATATFSAFWTIGQLTGATFLGGLTAVLSYPLILGLLLLRLVPPHSPFAAAKHQAEADRYPSRHDNINLRWLVVGSVSRSVWGQQKPLGLLLVVWAHRPHLCHPGLPLSRRHRISVANITMRNGLLAYSDYRN